MIVYKFGGATTRTRRGLEAVVELVRTAHAREVTRARKSRSRQSMVHGLVVVVSAIGHTTRHLARAAELSAEGNATAAEEQISRTLAQHQQLVTSLRLESEADVLYQFENIASSVRALMEGIGITREVSLRTRDAVLSHGEQFASAVIGALLQEHGLPVRALDAKDVIITDESFGHASPLVEEIGPRAQQKIVPRLKRSEIVMIPGFVGATRDGLTTTMGSESSDLTATLIAGALNAEEVIIWKMVSGIYSADPELIPSARLTSSLSFSEAEEIGRRGARILFPSIAHPLLMDDNHTVLRVSSPFARSKKHTVLQRELPHGKSDKALAAIIEQHLVHLCLRRREPQNARSSLLPQRPDTMFGRLTNLALYSWSTPVETNLLIRKELRTSTLAMLSHLGWEVEERGTHSALSVVVRRSGTNRTSFELQILRSLRQFGVSTMFPVENSIVALVPDSEGLPALRKLHHDLFEV